MSKLYENPSCIIGATKTGKSFYGKKTLILEESGVLYYNTLCDNVDMEGYIRADGKTDIQDLLYALNRGKKINYQAIQNRELRECEITYIIRELLSMNKIELKLVVDEVHLFEEKFTKNEFKNVSQFGRHSKITPVWISQRPQQLERSLITQSYKIIIFNTSMEDSYFKTYGIDPQKLKDEIQGRPYYYCEYDIGSGLSEAKKL